MKKLRFRSYALYQHAQGLTATHQLHDSFNVEPIRTWSRLEMQPLESHLSPLALFSKSLFVAQQNSAQWFEKIIIISKYEVVF